ncbi:unnamed protein product [Linum tenue]|uniref:AAA+ ATPase domain-containing protein n=1 Tax=Linum tenue TaxID=586396 RepID=A0AAV0QII8_9ROSI|nr:unnamed protein product [Linum tenue]
MHTLLAGVAILLPTFLLLRFLATTSIRHIVIQSCRAIADRLHLHQTYTVPQFDPTTLLPNPLYSRVAAYLSSLQHADSSAAATNLLSGSNPSHDIILSPDPNRHVITDRFLSALLSWSNHPASSPASGCKFVLCLRKKDKRRILRPYLQHILSVSEDVGREIKSFTTHFAPSAAAAESPWRAVPFAHPATMETVVMDADLKGKVKSDLELFLKSKQYYHRLGRAWKRSYLLHGPPGTGKSSFVAAMARFLCFDVYEIDFSKFADDSDLLKLLSQTTPRSVVVIEDLDRILANSSGNLSLSGLLKFMDGIGCEERVMIYTMTSKEGIDPSVLRPGRIDVQIHFPLCDFPAFKALAGNYLGVKEHKLFPQVEEVFLSGASLSPAEIGEIMIANRGSPSRALKSVITALQAADAAASDARAVRLMRESRASAAAAAAGDDGGGGVFCRESVHTVREFRKLYGLLRIGSRRKEESSVPSSELGGGSGPLEKEGRIEGGGAKS